MYDKNHKYSIEFILDYFEDNLAQEEINNFEEHLRDCESCKNYLKKLSEQEEFFYLLDLPSKKPIDHISLRQMITLIKNEIKDRTQIDKIINHLSICERCTSKYNYLKAKIFDFSTLTIDEILSSLDLTKDFTKKIYNELEPSENLEQFNEAWDYFHKELYDWDKGKYRKKEEEFSKITEGAFAFGPSIKTEPLFATIIRLIAEIRSWKIKKNIKSIHKKLDDLQEHLIKNGFKEKLINIIVSKIKKKFR